MLYLIYHNASKSISGDLQSHHRDRAGFEKSYAVAANGRGCPHLRRPSWNILSDPRYVVPPVANITRSTDARSPFAGLLCNRGIDLRLLVRAQSALVDRVLVVRKACLQHKNLGIDGRYGHMERAFRPLCRVRDVAEVGNM